jgi:hypothetical protein
MMREVWRFGASTFLDAFFCFAHFGRALARSGAVANSGARTRLTDTDAAAASGEAYWGHEGL